ncbi:unnamed protein product, partial [Prorocentrum cordatum]
HARPAVPAAAAATLGRGARRAALAVLAAFMPLALVPLTRGPRARPPGDAFAAPLGIGRATNPLDAPEVDRRPSKDLSAVDSVRVQLDALGDNDAPFRDHGVKTMYTFCGGAGLLELHEYFGYKKDLYHEEHFFGRFKSTFAKLIGHRGYTIDSSEERADESGGSYWVVRVSV